ncbi:MAG: divalent-cation tolerance protein CutA [Myxococcota bacterium]
MSRSEAPSRVTHGDAGGPEGGDAVRVVLVTAPDEETGVRVARDLVGCRLAACVNLVTSTRSVYRWEDEVKDEEEVLLLIKTRSDQCDALSRRIHEIHPYDVPEVLVLPAVGGSAAYLDWVRAESSP